MRKAFGLTAALALCVAAGEAQAIIGMPLTPMSYAGVARRTVRRTAFVAGAVTVAAATTAAVAVGTRVAALPVGCVTQVVPAGTYYACGSTYYRPYYDGPNVIYVVSPPP
jgi:hypothetical protein